VRFSERLLYHQVHPVKVLADSTSGMAALLLAWRGRAALGVAVVALPSTLSSALLIAFANLEREKGSRAGAYLRRYMTLPAQLGHLLGYAILFAGATRRRPFVMATGAAILLASWFYPVACRTPAP
jgi:hypothetical protein